MTTALLPRGSRFGEIRLTGFLGSGGFSDVYAGIDASGRKLAVKVFRNRTSDPDAQRRRIAAEREALSAVDSRGVAKLVADDLAAKDPWIASEFVDGLTIRESIEADGHLSREEALGVTRRLAEVLRDLHAAGIAHRDLTPSNIVFGQDGPVVIDFGSARMDLDYDSSGSILLAATPGFTPPEAVEGKSVGQKADVYALAKIAQFMSGDEAETFPTEIRQSLSPDPSDRPTAAAIADALANFGARDKRFKTKPVAKLSRRFSSSTVAAVSLGIAAITAAVLYVVAIRDTPVPSLYENERALVLTASNNSHERFHLGSPYIHDVILPTGFQGARFFLDQTTYSEHGDPFIDTTLLDGIHFSASTDPEMSVLLHAHVASPILLVTTPEIQNSTEFPADGDFSLALQFEADLATLDFDTEFCPPVVPDLVNYVPEKSAFLISAIWSCETERRVLMLALQPETKTLFRLSGFAGQSSRQELLTLFLSALDAPGSGKSSVIRLFEEASPYEDGRPDRISDAYAHVGYEADSLRTGGNLQPNGLDGRLAILLDPGQSFVPLEFVGRLEAWGLLPDRAFLPALTLGSFFIEDFDSSPIITNYFDEQLIVVLEAFWETDDPPRIDLVPLPGGFAVTDHLESGLYADELFSTFDEVQKTPLEIWTASGESVDPPDGEIWLDDILLSTPMMEALGEDELENTVNLAQLGSIYVPVPADLTLRTTGLGGVNYSVRANPFGLNNEIFQEDVARQVTIRSSEIILPGTNQPTRAVLEKGRWTCRTVRRGTKPLGVAQVRMTLTANCFDTALPAFPSSRDRMTNEHPHLEIVVFDPERLGDSDPTTVSPELLRIDLSLGQTWDIRYVRFLLSTLELQLADSSIEEIRDILGRPEYGIGKFDFSGNPLAD